MSIVSLQVRIKLKIPLTAWPIGLCFSENIPHILYKGFKLFSTQGGRTFQTKNYGLDSTDRLLQFSNYFFDASIEQIFLALLNGATTIIVDKQTVKYHTLPDFIEKNAKYAKIDV